MLLIAHRMCTIKGADKIVVLEDGRVSECGAQEALYAKNGSYRRMVQRQKPAR